MKLHLPFPLLVVVAPFVTLKAHATDIRDYPNSPVSYTEFVYGSIFHTKCPSISISYHNYSQSAWEVWNDGSSTLSNNGAVLLENNVTYPTSANVGGSGNGAAINCDSSHHDIFIGMNSLVSFTHNQASASNANNGGGAVKNGGRIFIRENDEVIFASNSVQNLGLYRAVGGAINNAYGALEFSSNTKVSFSNNSAISAFSAYGGALQNGLEGRITITGNDTVVFYNNIAQARNNGSSYGGAISNDAYRSYRGVVEIVNNGNVEFIGNTLTGGSLGLCSGAAIYNYGDLIIENNDNVIFRKNLEIAGEEYRLRSVYNAGGENAYASISAKDDHNIVFYDSVYSDENTTMNFNVSGKGDIIFSGRYVESDLRSLKGENVTQKEIENSKTSELKGTVSLHGGRLIVSDGAILKIASLETNGGSLYITNDAIFATTEELILSAGTLQNDGKIASKLDIDGAFVKGAGEYNETTLNSGKFVVGNSPGFIRMTGNLSLNGGDIVFSASGTDVASSDNMGWESGTYSSIDLQGNALTLSDSASIIIAFGGNALTSVYGAAGSGQTLRFTLIQNIGNIAEITESDLKIMALNTTMKATDEVLGIPETFTGSMGELFQSEDFHCTYSFSNGGDLVLSITKTPEPATAILSTMALSALCFRRRRLDNIKGPL